MAIFLDYIWQSTFCMLFFFGVYVVFLRNEKNFAFNRFYLLLTPLLALVFPLIQIPVEFAKPDISLEQTAFFKALSFTEGPEEVVATFGLPEVTVSSTKLPTLWTWLDTLKVVYLIAISIGVLRIFWSYIQLRLLKERGWYQTRFHLKDNYFFIPTFGLAPVFSYFNKLFWDDSQELSKEEEQQIIKHELIHIRQYHSYDIIYYQVLSILFWFNPIIHLMRSSIVDVHEYLADEGVLKETSSKETYPKLVVKMAFKGVDLPIGNYFIRSTTLKRIIMMKKSGKKNWLKTFMVLPLTGILLGLVAMKTKPTIHFTGESLFNKTEDLSQQLTLAQDSISFGVKVKKLKNPIHYEFIGPLQGDKLVAQLGELQYEFSDIQSTEDYIKVRGLIQTLRNNSRLTKSYPGVRSPLQVDVKAEPRIPFVEWQKQFLSALDIPEQEQTLGLLDKLTLELVVTETGKVSDVIIKNSIGAGLDQQAIDLLKEERFRQWNAARVQDEAIASLTQITFNFYPSIPGETRASLDFFNPNPVGNSQIIGKDIAVDLNDPTSVFDVVENPPSFQGGMEAFYEYIQVNKRYSEAAQRMGIEGNVYVAFIIDSEGKVKNPELLRGVMSELDREAIRLIENSPDWIPGTQRGRAVNVRMRLPIRFKLDQASNKQLNGSVVSPNKGSAEKKIAELRPSDAFNDFLTRNLKYPTESRKNGVSGIVHTELTLDKDGFIKSITIRETPNKELYSEVMWTMGQNRERWIIDGDQNEYKVQMPIAFNLPDLQQTASSGHPFEIKVFGYGAKDPKDATPGNFNLNGSVVGTLNLDQGVKFQSTQREQPVYVIDGVVQSQDYLNKKIDPNKIKTIEIVKGERAASMGNLYGSAVANGIIFIELKKD
ncbi:TonB family protein [Mongoliitalea daihaiensis]|uniref:TonB family protein n=1 Tax=Mongoliitalea daihaiensis TaxID=2782006 RepID=UPI001F1BC484|nr:TonB family protein [Mongoliitalea daihaiensis]UJP64269.1 TonB family protein [Mongoliitalea daihaiensis]